MTRFEICKDENGELRYIFAIQGHSGGVILSQKKDELRDDSLQVETNHLSRGSSARPILIAEIGLVAGGKERKEGRQTIFFIPLDPFNGDANEADSITDLKTPRKVKYQSRWRPEQDAVYWIHLSTAQDAGLEFWQTSSNATFTYHVVPKESVVKVVSESGKRELFARQLTPRGRPKVTLRPSWIYERSNTVSMPRETESNLQAWNCNPKSPESRRWPNKDIEQSIDLRVDCITNDETYKDEQHMQRIAEEVQKLVVTKEILKRRLTSGQHSQ